MVEFVPKAQTKLWRGVLLFTRRGGRPAVLRLMPDPRQGGVTPPYIALYKMCPRGGHTKFLIYYFLFIICKFAICKFTLPPPKYSVSLLPYPQRTKNFYVLAKKPGKNT